MRARHVRSLLFASLVCVLAAMPVATLAESFVQDGQTISIRDSRTGTGPCGFAIQREIKGTVTVTPSIDEAGNLMLAFTPADLHGSLVNPANGKSVVLRWIKQNGPSRFAADGDTTAVGMALTGHFDRGYETSRTDLEMTLPADSAAVLAFEVGEYSEDPWTHICGLLG